MSVLKRLAVPALALLLAAAPLAAQEANRNIRFGLPGPAKPKPSSREALLRPGRCAAAARPACRRPAARAHRPAGPD
jgi:hypothetical protein